MGQSRRFDARMQTSGLPPVNRRVAALRQRKQWTRTRPHDVSLFTFAIDQVVLLFVHKLVRSLAGADGDLLDQATQFICLVSG